MVNGIRENTNIQNILFPGKGENVSTTKGGGKPKTEGHWLLAQAVFGDDEKYRAALKACKAKKDKEKWMNKIKNKLKQYDVHTPRHRRDQLIDPTG